MNTASLGIALVKWFPIISTLVIIISFSAALINVPIIVNILSYPFGAPINTCILLLVLSKVFKFCIWHRVLIVNLLIIAIFAWINCIYRISSDLTNIWIILLIASISALLSLIIYSQYGWTRISTH